MYSTLKERVVTDKESGAQITVTPSFFDAMEQQFRSFKTMCDSMVDQIELIHNNQQTTSEWEIVKKDFNQTEDMLYHFFESDNGCLGDYIPYSPSDDGTYQALFSNEYGTWEFHVNSISHRYQVKYYNSGITSCTC